MNPLCPDKVQCSAKGYLHVAWGDAAVKQYVVSKLYGQGYSYSNKGTYN